MHNQNRIYRIFQLVNALKAKPPKSLTALTKHLETSERTVYRYLDLLKELGFKIERGKGPTFWITSSTNTEILPFTPQESDYVEKLIKSSGKQNKLAESVLMKVKNSRELHVGSNSMLKAHLGHIVEQISVAIIEKNSSSSETMPRPTAKPSPIGWLNRCVLLTITNRSPHLRSKPNKTNTSTSSEWDR